MSTATQFPAAGLIERVGAFAPRLTDSVDAINVQRRLPAPLVQELKDLGAFSIAVAAIDGGPELSPREQNEVVELLSYHDASVGWCVMIGSDAPYYGSFLERDAAAALWPSITDVTAGLLQPAGQARVADGGYVVNGRWSFGSGCTHADVIVGGCLVVDRDGALVMGANGPQWLVACAPAASWTVLDTWHTTGLRGSGSNDYTATDLFVPAEHMFDFSTPVQRPEPLYQFRGMFFANMSGVPLGAARRAIDYVRDLAQDKLMMPEMTMMRDLPRVRTAIARAEAQYGAARAYAYASLDALWEELQRDGEASTSTRVAVGLARANAFQMARDVTRAMCDTAGAASIYQGNPLEQLQRDAITMAQHIVTQDRIFEMLGELTLTGSARLALL